MYHKASVNILFTSLLLLIIFSIIIADDSQFAVESKLDIQDSLRTFYIVNHGWHTGIIINKNDLPGSLWPPGIDFADVIYFEAGWGDKDFYMSDDSNYFIAIKAAIWPTKSVMHIVGFYLPVKRYFISSEIIELQVNNQNYQKMCEFIVASFAIDSLGMAIPLGKGLYGNSQFFLGKKKYYYPNTCNVWTASVIYKAGFHIYPKKYQFAKDLMTYLKRIGKVINWPKE